MRALLVLLVVLPPLSGCLGGAEEPARISRSIEFGGVDAYEVDLRVEEGAKFTYEVTADRPLDWDVHTHTGEAVHTFDGGRDATFSGEVVAPSTGTYSIWLKPVDGQSTKARIVVEGAFVELTR